MVCNKCGKQLAENAKFCDGCGAALNNDPPTENQVPAAKNEDQDNKVIFVLSYLGILFFLPLVACPNSKVGRFHANQSLVLLITAVGGQIVLSIISAILWQLWIVMSLVSSLWGLALFALMIIGMVNAYKGEQKPLPIIGNITILN
ncbi:zinc-ribbon domain-containing protein [Neobacillus sp. NPDC093127]|uniref:zinc-ribbon domain-containing protein n=1 Tax=Neobacillus sp. NPDC093127 TaxID=3364296 RepID=UPI003800B6E4